MKRLTLAFLLLSVLMVAFAGSARLMAARPEERRREADRPEKTDRLDKPDPTTSADPAVKGAASQDKATFAADVAETEKFISENSPNRYRKMKGKFKPGPLMVARFREMRALKAEDQALYDIRVEEMKQEDVIFPLVSALRQSPGDAATKTALHDEVGKLIDLRAREHDYRIKKLEELLSAEKKKRENLRNREAAISKREQDEQQHNGNLFAPGAKNVGREQSELSPSDAGQ